MLNYSKKNRWNKIIQITKIKVGLKVKIKKVVFHQRSLWFNKISLSRKSINRNKIRKKIFLNKINKIWCLLI
jgi:hypothetical protein